MDGEKQTLQAIRFAAKNMPFLDLAVDDDLRQANCFAELMHGYIEGLVEPNMMRGLQPVGPGRTTLEVIIPSQSGLSPDKWKETATLCPLDWPSNYSLLRLWHTNGSLQQAEDRLRRQTAHSHMFASWTVHHQRFAERVLFRKPAVFVAQTTLQENIRDSNFPDRRVRKKALQLTWGPINSLSRPCISMRLIINKHTQSILSSPMSGSQQLHQTSNTIANV